MRLACTALAAWMTAGAVAAQAAPPSFRVVQEVTLPDAVAMAGDVRWATDQSLYVSHTRTGVSEVTLRGGIRSPKAVPGGRKSPAPARGAVKDFFYSWFLGASTDHLVVGSPLGALAAKPRAGGDLVETPFVSPVDLDVWRDRLVVAGVRGDEKGRWADVGVTLWSATLGKSRLFGGSQLSFTPLDGGPQGNLLQRCHILETLALRFFPDGRLAVALGVEPGVRLFDPRGKAVRTWPTAGLGYLDRCPVSRQESDQITGDMKARAEWLNRHQVLDEMVALPEGPLLVIRQPGPRGTRWRGVLLPFSGKPVNVALPLASPSRLARLKGDVRGDRIAFVIREIPMPETKRSTPTRAVIVRRNR